MKLIYQILIYLDWVLNNLMWQLDLFNLGQLNIEICCGLFFKISVMMNFELIRTTEAGRLHEVQSLLKVGYC